MLFSFASTSSGDILISRKKVCKQRELNFLLFCQLYIFEDLRDVNEEG